MDFRDIFHKFDKWADEFGPNFVIGLSGGGDSVGLLLICQKWLLTPNAKQLNAKIYPIIIDHNIASNSADVAQKAYETAKNLGFEPQIHKINHKITNSIQENARILRYELLHAATKELGANKILLAHNYGDLLETIIFRMLRGTDIFGLSGINEVSFTKNNILLRPLMNITREELRDICHENNVEYYDDPANDNDKFARVKIRKYLKSSGFDFGRLIEIAKNANLIRRHYEKNTYNFIIKNTKYIDGKIILSKTTLSELSQEQKLFVFSVLLRLLGNTNYPIARDKLCKLIDNIDNDGFKAATLGNIIIRQRHNKFNLGNIILGIAPPRRNQAQNQDNIIPQDYDEFAIKLAAICNINIL